MSIGYSTLTNLLSLDNIDYLNAKSITTTELYLQGSKPGLLTVSNEQAVVQKLSDGQLIIGNTSSGYNAASLTQGSNIAITNGPGSISVATTSDPVFNSVQTASTYMVDPSMSVTAINTVIANTNYSYIYFKPGTYTLSGCIVVARSNIVLDGCNGASLTLNSSVNQPNICIGDTATNPATIRYNNVTIKNFKINGSKSTQTTEFWSVHPWIPNSGISAMMISQLYIEQCNLDNCISAGLTFVNLIDDATVINCSSTLNYYDAYTFYGSKNLKFVNCNAYGHTNGAGFSFDNNNTNIVLSGCSIGSNKESIFARDSYNVVVTGCSMNNNTQQGVFLAGYGSVGNDRGCERWTFNNNTINNNGSQGIWLQACKKFSITGNTICNNGGIGCEFGNDTPGNADGTCSNIVLSSNVICSNVGAGIYNNSNNSYSSGARDNLFSMNIVKNNTNGSYTGDFTSVTIDDADQLNANLITVKNTSGNYSNISASSSGNSQIILPPGNGVSGQVLSTDGTGITSWSLPTRNINFINDNVTIGACHLTTWEGLGISISINRKNENAKIRISYTGQISYVGDYTGSFSISKLHRFTETELTGTTVGFATIAKGDFPASFTYIDTPAYAGSDTIIYMIVGRVFTSGTVFLNTSGIMQHFSVEEL